MSDKPVPGEKPTPEPGIEPGAASEVVHDANSAAVNAYRHPLEGPPPAPEAPAKAVPIRKPKES